MPRAAVTLAPLAPLTGSWARQGQAPTGANARLSPADTNGSSAPASPAALDGQFQTGRQPRPCPGGSQPMGGEGRLPRESGPSRCRALLRADRGGPGTPGRDPPPVPGPRRCPGPRLILREEGLLVGALPFSLPFLPLRRWPGPASLWRQREVLVRGVPVWLGYEHCPLPHA